MLRQILEECHQGFDEVGFNEVVLMLSNTAATSEVYMMLDDLRFSDDGNIVTFMAEGGTHLHMYLDKIEEVRFLHRMNEEGLPSYSVWFMDENRDPVLRIYLRKSEEDETNQPRHDLFMALVDKYGTTLDPRESSAR
ncbi:MAG: hypothetical protein OXN21_13340 [Chloroflexota bacterium]|nr:hypothetical protein [Chloroflexota bacterium]